jgi:hypothetical protein
MRVMTNKDNENGLVGVSDAGVLTSVAEANDVVESVDAVGTAGVMQEVTSTVRWCSSEGD